jgi:hypothetical protein
LLACHLDLLGPSLAGQLLALMLVLLASLVLLVLMLLMLQARLELERVESGRCQSVAAGAQGRAQQVIPLRQGRKDA